MKISKECEEYEIYARRSRAKEPFPIEIKDLTMYIRYRGRSKTFRKFLVNLDIHPLHGPEWLERINKNSIIRKEMRQVIKKWKFNLKESQLPLVGVDYTIDSSYYDATDSEEEEDSGKKSSKSKEIKYKKKTKNKEIIAIKTPSLPPPPQFPNVYSVAGPKTKVGFVFASKPVDEEAVKKPSNKCSTDLSYADIKISTNKEKKPITNEASLFQVVPSTPTPTLTPTRTPSPTSSSSKIKTLSKDSMSMDIPGIKHPIVVIHQLEDVKKRKRSIQLPKLSEHKDDTIKKASKGSKSTINKHTPKKNVSNKSAVQQYKPNKQKNDTNGKLMKEMEWMDVEEPIPSKSINELIYDYDTQFTDDIYEKYLDLLAQAENNDTEMGIREVEAELMVLSHVAIERYY